MINLTEGLIYLSDDKTLATATAKVLDRVCKAKTLHAEGTKHPDKAANHAFSAFLSREARKNERKLGRYFLDASLTFACSNSRNLSLGTLTHYSTGKLPSATGLSDVLGGIRLTLLHLWDEGHILLPFRFLPRSTVHRIDSTKLSSFGINLEGWRKNEYIFHFLRATDWKKIEDISIGDAAAFMRAHTLFRLGQLEVRLTNSPIPVTKFLSDALLRYPDKVSYSQQDLAKLSNWAAGQQH
jgi:hypothetical protein